MKINKIENRIAYFILTFALFLLNFKNITILSLLFGSIISLPIILLFEKINIYKYKIFKIFLFIISSIFITYFLNKISYYIGYNILREYSIFIISLTLFLSVFILGNKGYHTIIKVLILASYFIVLFMILGNIILIPELNIENFNDYYVQTNYLIKQSLLVSFNFIYPYILIYPLTNTKFLKIDLITSCLNQIINYFFIISILGLTLTNIYKYPYIDIFKSVSLLGFIERIEIIFSFNYLFFMYFIILFSYYQIYYLLKKLIKKDKIFKIILSIYSIIIFLLSFIFY